MNEISARLLAWYARDKRDLPWRRSRDPYAIWVSEMMLQQTQVSTVLPYYRRWLERFPTVHALADASEDDVLHAWQGLGYYSRARRLLAGARAVVERHAGRLPQDVESLRALPGIGPYTAGAIASIAFGKPEPVVDGNVRRVLCRLFAERGDPARAPLATRLWQHAAALIPREQPADFNQALMELGATLCTPKKPACDRCPLAELCRARAQGLAEQLPESAAPPPATRVSMVAAVVLERGRALVVKLPDSAPRWAGMWQFPSVELGEREPAERALGRATREAAGLEVAVDDRLAVIRHSVTRFRITLEAYRCRRVSGRARARSVAEVAWCDPDALAALALPSAHRKLAQKLGSAP